MHVSDAYNAKSNKFKTFKRKLSPGFLLIIQKCCHIIIVVFIDFKKEKEILRCLFVEDLGGREKSVLSISSLKCPYPSWLS